MEKFVKPLATGCSVLLGLGLLSLTEGCAASHLDQENIPFTASNALQSEYHVYAANVPQPSGLLIWTYGDGAWEFIHPDDPYAVLCQVKLSQFAIQN